MAVDFENLVADYYDEKQQDAIEAAANEMLTDISKMSVAIEGLQYRGKIIQCRVFIDHHRCQRALTTSRQKAEGKTNPAVVGYLQFDGTINWLQGYTWAFDEDSKSYVPGALTPAEVEKITTLAKAELERIRPQIDARNKGENIGSDNTGTVEETESGIETR